jgi:hypothetical protein
MDPVSTLKCRVAKLSGTIARRAVVFSGSGYVLCVIGGMALSASIGVWIFESQLSAQNQQINVQSQQINDRMSKLEERYASTRTLFSQMTNRLNDQGDRSQTVDLQQSQDIGILRSRIAAIEAQMPAYLPTVDELLRIRDYVNAQNGRLDEMTRRQEAQSRLILNLCTALGGISQASAKKAGC